MKTGMSVTQRPAELPPPSPSEVLETVRRRLRSDQRLEWQGEPVPVCLAMEGRTLEMTGELPSVAIKRRALRVAAAVPGVEWIADRLRITPATRMTDAQIRDHVCDALLDEPALVECALEQRVKGKGEWLRRPAGARGEIAVSVEDGVVTLEGEVPTRAHARLAIVLAWWVPGTREVVDGLGVRSSEPDNDDEISDAVRMALEKDPFVDATQIRVFTQANAVTLTGLVPSEEQRRMAEEDAWYVIGVGEVTNAIEVEPAP